MPVREVTRKDFRKSIKAISDFRFWVLECSGIELQELFYPLQLKFELLKTADLRCRLFIRFDYETAFDTSLIFSKVETKGLTDSISMVCAVLKTGVFETTAFRTRFYPMSLGLKYSSI